MENALLISMYRDVLRSMKCQKSKGMVNLAKPTLLLSIIKMVDNGKVSNNIFKLEDLRITYDELKEKYSVSTPFCYPIYHMGSESFYHINWVNGHAFIKVSNDKFVRENIKSISLDNALWDLLQDESLRNDYTESITKFYML